jgi:hypothetical protein
VSQNDAGLFFCAEAVREAAFVKREAVLGEQGAGCVRRRICSGRGTGILPVCVVRSVLVRACPAGNYNPWPVPRARCPVTRRGRRRSRRVAASGPLSPGMVGPVGRASPLRRWLWRSLFVGWASPPDTLLRSQERQPVLSSLPGPGNVVAERLLGGGNWQGDGRAV